MDQMPIDKLRLRFTNELEEAFQEESFHSSLKQLRIHILVVAFIYALFGIVDVLVTPEVKFQAWFIRYAIIVPTAIGALVFSFFPQFRKYQQVTVSFLVLVGGAGIVALIVYTHKTAPYLHFAGLLLVFMTAYTAFRLRFLYATVICWAVIGLYEISALWISHIALPVFLTNNFFFVSINLMGMFTNYQRELYSRREFFQNRMIQMLEKERHVLEKEQMKATMDKAIQSLRESEAKFRTLAKTAAMGIFIHQGGNFLYANRAAEVIGGYTFDEYLGMNFLSLVHPDFLDLVKSRANDRLAGGSEVPTQYEFKIVRKNGEARWVLMTGGVTEFEGRPAIIGTIVDIHARKQAEEERNQMVLVVENSSDFIGMATMDGQVIFVNRAGRRLLGIDDAHDMKKMSMSAFFMEEDAPYLLEQLLPNDIWRGEHRLRHFKTANPIPVDVHVFTIFDDKTGKPLVRAAVIRDITDQKRAEEERERLNNKLGEALFSLKESESRFRALAETTTAATIIHRGGKFLYTNPAVTKYTGYTLDELLNMEFWELVHPDFQEMVRQTGQARARGEDVPRNVEFMILTKSGESLWVNGAAGTIEFDGRPAVIVALFDISDRKRAEEEKAKLYEERIAEEKQHVLEKEKILMDLHDGIGGITTNISILAELGQKASDMDRLKSTLGTISQLSREGISEIRSFMHSLDSRELSWRTLAVELRSQGTSMMEAHGIRFQAETLVEDLPDQPGSLLWVNLFRIYKEALTNIIKHSRATMVDIKLNVARDGLLLSVRDNGTGWDAATGKGRGLSTMRKRGEEVGGKLALSSSLGNGAHITLEVPLPLKYPFRV